ncbi:MAG: (p)ppGpp synthetase SpoT/RelA [Actinomycetia bacterium]|nr:(p)ppGpp synthetase SpoT/RelA [Actinomycetes bacterium]
MTTFNPAEPGARPRLHLPWPRRRTVPGPAPSVQPAVEPLLSAYRAAAVSPPGRAEMAELRRAYAVAERMHRGQTRKSGAPYITHPLAVATILAALGMDATTLVAALLHDTVEDTPYTLGQVRAEFGDEVAVLVDGVTKLDGERWGDRAEAETFRKIVLAAAADLRVLVIKLADRLHNLRTLGFKEPKGRERIARASLELLVPFAERLGIYALKREMDDLSFAALDPGAYTRTRAAAEAALARAGDLGPALGLLRSGLAAERLPGEVSLRPRHLYQLFQDRGGDLTDLRPNDAARVMVVIDGTEQDCYVALGAVHAALHPIPGRVKDFIALPKFNLYQSLHTVVIGPRGDLLDVIIRNREMHRVAEYGIIAHIRDASDQAATADAVAGRRDLGWLRRLLTWQSGAASAEFLDSLRSDLSTGHVPVFTPAGDIVALPAGATAIDFAYALGADTGDHCIGAVVNGRLAALSAGVRGGDVVEILTAPDGGPSGDWLLFATTAQTRVHIQQRLSRERADEASDAGRRTLVRALADHRVDLLAAEGRGESLSIARELGFAETDLMYAALDGGSLDLATLVTRFAA